MTYQPQELRNFLEFIRKFRCSSRIRNYVVSFIRTSQKDFQPSEIVHWGVEYGMREFLELGFKRLIETPLTKIERPDRDRMGMTVFLALVDAKAHLDKHDRIVAAEPPEMKHARNCRNRQGCAEDWRAVWWNVVGRSLLDGRNPWPLDEALKRFKCSQFGRVDDECRQIMFTEVMNVNKPLLHAQRFIRQVTEKLVQMLIPT